MSENFWFKDPAILFTSETWSRFVPTNDMTTAEALNSVVRFSTYFSILLYVCSGVGAYLLTIPAVMVTTVILYRLFPNGKVLESFTTRPSMNFTMPTASNPFMNVLLTDIQDNPNRPDAAPVGRHDVKAEIHKAFQKTTDLYMDTTDMFDQSLAMRTFHTIQSARVPNDQDGFLKWLAKGNDLPNNSSAPDAKKAKLLNEGHVAAKGSMRHLPSSTAQPSGVTPSSSS